MGQDPGTLILRVEGPAAVEIQHLANVICERVNRFLGWRAVERIALRQAPLRNALRQPVPTTDPAAAARIAAACRRSQTTICDKRWPGLARPSDVN